MLLQRIILGTACVLLLVGVPGVRAAGSTPPETATPPEPNMQLASQWWPDLPDIWTPMGWKDSLFRYLVLFNGTIVASPVQNGLTQQYAGEGVQLAFLPSHSGEWIDPASPQYPERDDGSVLQGWNPGEAPVLWSEWARDGLLLRQETFCHIPGGAAVARGDEPLFMWVRLSVHKAFPVFPLEDKHGFGIRINTPHITHSMEIRNNINFHNIDRLYPRALALEPAAYDRAGGVRLIEPDGRVRLAVAPDQACTVTLRTRFPSDKDSYLHVGFDAAQGTHVDLLVPMLPMPREVFDAELALGYEAALRQTEAFWAQKPATAAQIDTPEPYINEAIRYGLIYDEMIADRDPASGTYALLTAAWPYAAQWSTPMAMTAVQMDLMGYHASVARYLEIFRTEQGQAKPPTPHMGPHAGYLGTKTRAAVGWMSDHGAILYTLSQHALLTGDAAYSEQIAPVIVKGCEFIRDARGVKGHGGVEGVMPPSVANDFGTSVQNVWVDGWNYLGLTRAVRLLTMLKHPRAAEFAAEAEDYKSTFGKAFRAAAEKTRTWQDQSGKTHHFVPSALTGEADWEVRSPFYLDCGPLFLVFSGLIDAQDPLMDSARRWFREGPPQELLRFDAHMWQIPCLIHEMSSSEPVYSWNIFHSWMLADRYHYLEGMYSLFAGSISRKTYSICETRGGVTGLTMATPLVYLTRLAAIDEWSEPGTLHLMRLFPLAWLNEHKPAAFDAMPTEFGPVTLRAQLAAGGGTLRVTFEPRFRSTPDRIMLHIPPVPGLKQIELNGEPLAWNPGVEAIELDQTGVTK